MDQAKIRCGKRCQKRYYYSTLSILPFLKNGEKVYDINGDITVIKLKSVIKKIKQLNAKVSLCFLREIEDSEFEGTIIEYLSLELIWNVSMSVDEIK